MNTEFRPTDHPHRRYNPLLDEYVLVSPHRAQRPWQGKIETAPQDDRPAYDPTCYLCPGNTRTSGAQNPEYDSTFVFTNDFQALLPDTPTVGNPAQSLLQTQSVQGTCRVICFSPRHDLTLARMSLAGIRGVIDLWSEQTVDLGKTYRWVQVFENRGAMMGSSNPHPHGQIWAESALPNLPAREDANQAAYFGENGSRLLMDYAHLESSLGDRTISENDAWIVIAPYWAVWPFEALLLPKQRVARLPDLDEDQRTLLAAILKDLLVRFDNLFETSFPYSMGWHGAPCGDEGVNHWQLHAHFYPPLLRSATIQKFMVGYELLAEAQRDLTPELASQRLRDVSAIHYLEQTR